MTHCPPRELTSRSHQRSALPAAEGGRQCLPVPAATCGISKDRQNPMHNFPSWMEANRTSGLRTQSPGDKARRRCHQLLYQGCVPVGGPSASPRASEERRSHTEQFSSRAGWLQTIKLAGSFTTLTLAGCLRLRKSNDPQRVKQMKKYKHPSLVLAEGLGKAAHLHLKMMKAPQGLRLWEVIACDNGNEVKTIN